MPLWPTTVPSADLCVCGAAVRRPGEIIDAIHGIPGIEAALDRETACARYELPADREGDVAVIAAANTCIGASATDHDLSGLAGHRLRTHGGLSEATVPFIISQPLNDAFRLRASTSRLKSYEIFDFALNGVAV